MERLLLLADFETKGALFPQGLPQASLHEIPHSRPEVDEAEYLFSELRDLDDLRAQRWGLIVPEHGGDERLKCLAPLIEARARQQGIEPGEVRIYKADMNTQPTDWIHKHLQDRDSKRPRYVLMLGDLSELPLELQTRLMDFNYFPGRLAFDKPEHYGAYAQKVLAWEPFEQSGRARVAMISARTPSASTAPDHGFANLMKPAQELAATLREESNDGFDFMLEEPIRRLPIFLQDVLEVVRDQSRPTLLWTMSYGRSAPLEPAEKKMRVQGSPVFGLEPLTPELSAEGAFLPGGIWFHFGCFGAGTPNRSVYWPWIRRLKESKDNTLGGFELHKALRCLPKEGEFPFVAAVPKAALANPLGPLAVLGHVDLAWVHSYRSIPGAGVDPRARFLRVPSMLADPSLRYRLGHAVAAFRKLHEIDATLISLYDCEEEARQKGESSPVDPITFGNLWMHRQDLAQYVLLGDPAVRLPGR